MFLSFFLTHPLGMPEPPFPQDEEVSPSNPFLEEEEAGRRDARSLERALDMLMVTTSRRCPRESDSVAQCYLLQVKEQHYESTCTV